MKYDIIDILNKDFERLSPSELAECVDLFSTEEEFLALKKSMLMIKSEQMKDEITPDNKLKSSLMDQFNQKWKEESTSWYERLIAFILGPSKPLIARPWFVATGIAVVTLLVFVTLPLNDNQPQMAEVFESTTEELRESEETKEKMKDEAPINDELEAGSVSVIEKEKDYEDAKGEVISREQITEENKNAEELEDEIDYFSFAERNEISDVEAQEKVSSSPSISRNKNDDNRIDQLRANTLDEIEMLSQKNIDKIESKDKKLKSEFRHSDWLDSDAEKERKEVLSKAKTDLLMDLLEPAF